MLERLNRKAIPLAVCTNKPQGLTEAVLACLGIARHFALVVGANEARVLKPAPDMLTEALRALGAAAPGSVMVGDSGADAAAAHAAGTHLILMEHGYCGQPLHELGAAHVLASFAELPQALARVTG